MTSTKEDGVTIQPALTEIWRPVVGYEGLYEVSDLGRVRRLSGLDSIGRPRCEKVLRLCDNGRGYIVCSLSRDSQPATARVHSLVAAAWLGLRPTGMHVNHIDGTKKNNAPLNLEYTSPGDNTRHAARLGLHPKRERHGGARLSETAVAEIREQRTHRTRQNKEMAVVYGVSESSIERVLSGYTWSEK